MNCKQVNQFILEHLGETLPADVRAHLDQCQACNQLYVQQCRIKDLLYLRNYEEPKSGRVERGISNIMREARLREDQYESRQRRFMWVFTEPRYGIAMLFLVFVGLNLIRNDRARYAGPMTRADDAFGSNIMLLNEAPQEAQTNGYDYPEFDVDQIPGVMPNLGQPVKLVNFAEEY